MLEKSKIRVMILDDEQFMLKLLGRMLVRLGYTNIFLYDSARTALDSFATPSGPPDLILLDLNMPEMDGIEFARYLVERQYTGSLILISGEDERMLQSARKIMQAHGIEVLGHLHKPVSLDALAVLMVKWKAPSLARPLTVKSDYDAKAVQTAIANNELINYYQPKVAVADGQLVGVETLVRWQHPDDGLIFPDQFVAVAEANGLINDLTSVVLRNALAQSRLWRDAGLMLRVAINVSMDNLTSLDFADFLSDAAKAAGVPPSAIVLEVTESRLMANLRIQLEVLTRLRLKRFRLSIDDFGTGHSSLVQLRDVPFEELKIDRSFVHRAYADETLRAIFDGSLNMARQLDMEVVAEGVEDSDDWDFLRQTSCDLAQGYFIGRPMPAAHLPHWIEIWKTRMRQQSAIRI